MCPQHNKMVPKREHAAYDICKLPKFVKASRRIPNLRGCVCWIGLRGAMAGHCAVGLGGCVTCLRISGLGIALFVQTPHA
ncbi:hypothetical protein K491DRAFT_74451 [Lophiostoma macrostomum CBS 122681]|uniref:Uncharacterized protein n=1 Tax=Lophiostoma macrostomum CBS 122681 TaxID=1314788 RepID=A0A6A6T039_9PLEO|nr:hypothetical protein K491DRAFT_74451 [Lophiostoma macrostomum CBS 122681]